MVGVVKYLWKWSVTVILGGWHDIIFFGGVEIFLVLGAKIFKGGVPKFLEGRVAKYFGWVAKYFFKMGIKNYGIGLQIFLGAGMAKLFGVGLQNVLRV